MDWESVDSEGEENFDDNVEVQNNVQLPKGSDYKDLRNYVRLNSKFTSTKSLILPDDKIVGHKINSLIYKQKHDEIIDENKIQRFFKQI